MDVNPALAARARAIANKAPRGSLARRSAGCVWIALGTTKTAAGARKVIAEIGADDIREAAGGLLGELLAEAAGIVRATP
jgi:hypothetical protein